MIELPSEEEIISTTELQRDMKSILERLLTEKQNRFLLMRGNKPVAVLISTNEYARLSNKKTTCN